MASRAGVACVLAASMAMAAACGKSEAPSQSASQAAAPATAASESHEGHAAGTGRVFFVSPKNGDTVKSPVKFEFGSEAVTIAPVPQGDVTSARPGIAHYHLGIDTGCMPAGEVIPRGVPQWIHFGTGSNTLEYQATMPGKHMFVLQAGDDQHKALPNMCEQIEVTIQG